MARVGEGLGVGCAWRASGSCRCIAISALSGMAFYIFGIHMVCRLRCTMKLGVTGRRLMMMIMGVLF